MDNITELNQYRQAKQVKFAEDQGWDVVAQSEDPLAKVWVYSVDYNGRIRFGGQLLQSAGKTMDEKKEEKTPNDVLDASTAIRMLDSQRDDEKKQTAGCALVNYFAKARTWALIEPKHRRKGLHLVVLDWPEEGDEIITRPGICMGRGKDETGRTVKLCQHFDGHGTQSKPMQIPDWLQ